jgi:putative membrane protein
VIVTDADQDADFSTIEIAPDPANLPVVATPTPKHRFPWGTLLWSALGGLASLALGLAVSKLIEDLYARSMALGWFGVALAAAAALARHVIVAREVRGLLKHSAMEAIRNKAI